MLVRTRLLPLLLPLSLRAASAVVTPPPGCNEDSSSPQRWVCIGMELTLAPCNGSDNRQHWFTRDGGGTLQHYDPGYGGPAEAVTSWDGNDYGWSPSLSLQPLVPGFQRQSWWEPSRATTDDTSINNVENTTAGNVSAVLGCRQWAVDGEPALAAGARVRPAACVDLAAAAGRSFAFDVAPDLLGLITALTDPANTTSYSGLCVAVDTAGAATLGGPIVVDDNGGANFDVAFDGVGAQFGKASARLLFDYPQQQQQEILDFLFKPGVGASLSIAQIEIGGDGQTIQGSTPSHQHFRGEPPNAARGTQGWLAAQARLRNPAVKLYALPYSFPGWLGPPAGARNASAVGEAVSPFGDPAATAAYVVAYLQGLTVAYGSVANVTVDVVGLLSDVWQSPAMPNYAAALRAALDAAGMRGTAIECADSLDAWQCANQAVDDPALLAAVSIFGGHNIPTAGGNAFKTGKPMWRTYMNGNGFISDLMGAASLAYNLQSSFLARLGAGIVWGGLAAQPDGQPERAQGLVRADSPVVGHYFVTPSLWTVAHTSAFAQPGWMQLKQDVGTGVLTGGGSYITRMATDGTAWSIVALKCANSDFNTNKGFASEMVTFALRGRALAAVQNSMVYVFQSNLGGSASGNVSLLEFVGNSSVFQPTPGGDSIFSVFLATNTITTITSSAPTFAKLSTQPPPPLAFPSTLALDFTDTVGGRPPPQPAALVLDINGAFEMVDDPAAGRALQQTAASRPITRFQTDTAPHAIVGDEDWEDLDVAASIWMPTADDGALLCARCSGLSDGDNNHVTGMDALPGTWFSITATDWQVKTRLDGAAAVLRSGTFAPPLALAAWHSVRLVVRGSRVVASVDGVLAASFNNEISNAPRNGFAAIGAVAFGARPLFGSLTINATSSACSGVPREGHLLKQQPCALGLPKAQSFDFVAQGGGVGQLVAVFNESLCVACNRSSDPVYRYQNTRAGFIALCNASDPRQLFQVEASATVGPYSAGPVQGPDGLTLNIFGSSDSDNIDIAFYPWQGSSNAHWVQQDPYGFYNPFFGTCLTACDDVQ